MNKVEQFLWANHLKQKDLCSYLGITSGAASNYVARGEFSKLATARLINNPYGWDASMLDDSVTANGTISPSPDKVSETPAELVDKSQELSWYKRMFIELTNRIAEQDKTICCLQERVEELENGKDK